MLSLGLPSIAAGWQNEVTNPGAIAKIIAVTGGFGKLGRTVVTTLEYAGRLNYVGTRGESFTSVDLIDYGQTSLTIPAR